MNNVFKKIYIYLKKVNEKKYLAKYYNTTKCPKCKKWSHEKYIDNQEDSYKFKSWGYIMRCGNCNKKSRWNTVAFPFPYQCKKKGKIENK